MLSDSTISSDKSTSYTSHTHETHVLIHELLNDCTVKILIGLLVKYNATSDGSLSQILMVIPVQ